MTKGEISRRDFLQTIGGTLAGTAAVSMGVFNLRAQPAEIKIGVMYPLSGGLAATGRDMKAGAELAADVINNKYPELDIPMAKWEGIPNLGGAKIKLIVTDHRAEPARGADLAKRLIRDEKVTGLSGAWNSSVTKTSSAVAERFGVPFINGSSSSPTLTKRGLDWFWRVMPHSDFFILGDLPKFINGLIEGKASGVGPVPKAEVDQVAIATENTEAGAATRDLLLKVIPDLGFDIVAELEYSHGAADLTSESRKIVASGAETYLMYSYVSDAILYMKTFKEMKASPNLFWANDGGFVSGDFVKTLGKDANGVLTRAVFAPSLARVKPVAGQINKVYKQRTGEDLSGPTARAFTEIQIWGYVLNKAASTKPKAIKKTLNELNIPADELIMPWKGIKFGSPYPGDQNQNVLASGIIGQYQDGELETTYPFDVASADMLYPFPGYK